MVEMGLPTFLMENKTDREAEIKEKLLRSGKLTDWDLLELLLTYVSSASSPQEVAEELKRTFHSMRAIFLTSSVELLQVKGMDRDAATLIRLVGEILERFSETMAPSPQVLVNSKEVEQFLLAWLSTMKDENVLLVFLDDHGIVLGQEILGAGTVDQVVLFPRQVMERALTTMQRH
nr:JAB domain-containing protein [Desulfomonile tiedjei]